MKRRSRMTEITRACGLGQGNAWWMLVALCLPGCSSLRNRTIVPLASPVWAGLTIAVAPAINQSGSADFDPNRFADLMASELSHAHGIGVIPVSRVLAVLAAQGLKQVTGPSHAHEVMGLLGADAILVFAVTEYDPFDPPSIGISAQLYGAWPGSNGGAMDPVALSRQTTLTSRQAGGGSRRLLAQMHRVFNASLRSTIREIKVFAADRDGDTSPYGWRKYMVSQQHYIRYCCHATIRALLGPRYERVRNVRQDDRGSHEERDSTAIAG